MKQLAYLIIGLGIGFLACKLLSKTEDIKVEPVEVSIIKPKGVITPAKAIELDKNYNDKYETINREFKIEDNRSSWYSLADIKDYLAYAENQAGELKYQMDGIRIYLGSHGEDGLTTMFIVPTGVPNIKGANNFLPPTSNDIPDGDVLNQGGTGHPPSANYPQ